MLDFSFGKVVLDPPKIRWVTQMFLMYFSVMNDELVSTYICVSFKQGPLKRSLFLKLQIIPIKIVSTSSWSGAGSSFKEVPFSFGSPVGAFDVSMPLFEIKSTEDKTNIFKVHSMKRKWDYERISLHKGSSLKPLRQVKSLTAHLHQTGERLRRYQGEIRKWLRGEWSSDC